VIHVESTLSHHLLNAAIRKLIAAIPTNTQKNNGWLKVPPLEGGLSLLYEYDSRGVMAELKGDL
jgi:hypothetical protein